jgi:hypothetical protein
MTMTTSKRLRTLEGLGYVAAILIGVGGLTDILGKTSRVMKTFNIIGLVFGVIVIVRLIVMNISQAELNRQMMERPPSFDSETTVHADTDADAPADGEE